jgi:hypothetical protein
VMSSSLLYHYTGNKTIRIIDMITVQVCLWYGLYQVLSWHPYCLIGLAMLTVIGIIYWQNEKSDSLHSLLHLGGSIAVVLCVEGHYLSRLNHY